MFLSYTQILKSRGRIRKKIAFEKQKLMKGATRGPLRALGSSAIYEVIGWASRGLTCARYEQCELN